MIVGMGIDITEIGRIEAAISRHGRAFLERIFTASEIAYCERHRNRAERFAGRFAAKEAVSKAFGTGIGKAMGWRDIDIRKKPSGEPFLIFSGGAKELAQQRGVTTALITLSHTEQHAMATVVLEG